MNAQQSLVTILTAASLLAACGGPGAEQDTGAEGDAAGTEQAPMADMPGMQRMQDRGMMDEMRAHMQMMQGMRGDSVMAVMPQHRQMVANMIAQMNREMRDMNMATDSAWDTTADSLRQDLTRMPSMSSQELESFMPEHHRRMMTLMEMHRRMTDNM